MNEINICVSKVQGGFIINHPDGQLVETSYVNMLNFVAAVLRQDLDKSEIPPLIGDSIELLNTQVDKNPAKPGVNREYF